MYVYMSRDTLDEYITTIILTIYILLLPRSKQYDLTN